ncbi:hypothetical protein FBQ97_22320 [Acidobacteria bacterium ACD]|nr:MAG: hypothetical protein EDX89_03270 [Acidobacteriota bacterium]MCE7956708.1 hypothetical protein [Acidobacteria bacterium ACB2]MDL1952514.1 hypothetical protein [Acidobacteria bacterium ACD]
MNWRHLNNVVHRDVGYLCVALTVIYAVSGVAVNHKEDWNPSRRVLREVRRFEPVPVGEREAMVAALVDRLALPGPPKSSFRSAPHLVDLFYDGFSVRADAASGVAEVERVRDRLFLRDANFLHLNEPKRLWTWVADLYAVLLLVLSVTGMFVLKGRNGLGGRGKWLVLAGLAVPLAFLLVLRYL